MAKVKKKNVINVEILSANETERTVTLKKSPGLSYKKGQPVVVTVSATKPSALGIKRKVSKIIAKGFVKDINGERVVVSSVDENLAMKYANINKLGKNGIQVRAID